MHLLSILPPYNSDSVNQTGEERPLLLGRVNNPSTHRNCHEPSHPHGQQSTHHIWYNQDAVPYRHISLWEGCQNFGILLLTIERVPFSRHNLRTHQYDTKYLNHIEKADSLSFPTIGVWGSRTELLGQNIAPRKRFRLLFFRF